MKNIHRYLTEHGWSMNEEQTTPVFEALGVSVQTETTIYNNQTITDAFPDDHLGSFIFISELQFSPELTPRTVPLIQPLVSSQSQDKITSMLESRKMTVSNVEQREIQIGGEQVVSQRYICEAVIDATVVPMRSYCYFIRHNNTYSIVGSTRPHTESDTHVDSSILETQKQVVKTVCEKLVSSTDRR